MNNQEMGKCDFCGEVKPVLRQYLHALKKEHIDENEHTPFTITRYCADCGLAELPAVEVAVNPTRQHAMKCPKLHGEECTCDGYHTFDELYDHRITLFIALCASLRLHTDAEVWRSERHSDGEFAFGGTWYVLGIGSEKGKQITYHIPMERWNESNFALTYEKAPEFDGHTSADVLARVKAI